MEGLTYFFAGRTAEFEEDSNDDEERDVELDTLNPTRFVWIDSHAPFMEFHLLRLNVQDTTYRSNKWSIKDNLHQILTYSIYTACNTIL